jgi:hypothetical protein
VIQDGSWLYLEVSDLLRICERFELVRSEAMSCSTPPAAGLDE